MNQFFNALFRVTTNPREFDRPITDGGVRKDNEWIRNDGLGERPRTIRFKHVLAFIFMAYLILKIISK